MLLHYAVGHLVEHDYATAFSARHNVNCGAVFAHYLVGLQRKPFMDKKKNETIWSLLIPIFQHCRIDLDKASVISKKDMLGEAYLKHTGMIIGNWMYVFTDSTGMYHIQLPQAELAAVSTQVALHFQPDPSLLVDVPPSRKRRRSLPSTATPSTHVTLHIDHTPHLDRSLQQIPVDLGNDFAFRQYIVASF